MQCTRGLELVGEMKRLRRAPEPTSAMEPWLQKAVHDKVLMRQAPAPDAQSTHLPVRPWPPLQWQCGLQGARPSTCASDGPREEECAEGGTL